MRRIRFFFVFTMAVVLGACQEEANITEQSTQPSFEKTEAAVVQKEENSGVKSAVAPGMEISAVLDELLQTNKKAVDDSFIGKQKQELIKKFGQPDETGWFQGGEYVKYDQAAYFLKPQSNQIHSMAVEINEHNHFQTENKEQLLGKASEAYWNEMNNLWTEVYKLSDGKLILEKKSKQAEQPVYIWLEHD
ncbi:hypothetical protein SAMN05192534_10126 [Alteribacillus persepolensis]|uniref:Lipoprotein n=1 Tax=Alteribacillus persepolensis TaxID=568899 RepID=A0A1G7Y7Z1_9BACI|nr:DUF4309 domain-containing protein [Alteribacillus persepolensis]SDG92477.1 hypothetical protein SAMN05192534_10126 [Alteribacillus persepolensis]